MLALLGNVFYFVNP